MSLLIALLAAATVSAAPLESRRSGNVFRDCPDCPEMVVVPPGHFFMGSPATEKGRGTDESPQRLITIAYPLAVSRFDITRSEFDRFVREVGRRIDTCSHPLNNGLVPRPGIGWTNPFAQTKRDPVVCISWEDAKAYISWLSARAGHPYRLLSEAEWEYAARARTNGARYYGDDPDRQCLYADGADRSGAARHPDWSGFVQCSDGYPESAPVGRFRPNGFGLYDMLGNVNQWIEDCYQPDFAGAPVDGSPMETCAGHRRLARGGDWNSKRDFIRAASRDVERPDARVDTIGLRVARSD